MDDEAATEDSQRVRILSTLESSRHASRPSRTKGGRRTSKSHRRSWLQGALWGAMGVGVLALMAGFVLVIQDSKPAIAQVPPAPAPHARLPASARQDTHAPSADVVAPTAAGPAVIETTHADTPLAALSTVATAPSATAPALPPPIEETDRVAANNHKAASPPAAKSNLATANLSPPKAGKAAAAAKDEDVALLEAMFAHTGRKAPPPKPAAPKN